MWVRDYFCPIRLHRLRHNIGDLGPATCMQVYDKLAGKLVGIKYKVWTVNHLCLILTRIIVFFCNISMHCWFHTVYFQLTCVVVTAWNDRRVHWSRPNCQPPGTADGDCRRWRARLRWQTSTGRRSPARTRTGQARRWSQGGWEDEDWSQKLAQQVEEIWGENSNVGG